MKLKKLLKNIPIKQVKGSKELEITGVCANSKLVSPGNLFIAKKGRIADGSLFIPEAIESGAAAVLTDIYDPSLKITQIIHPDIGTIESALAAQYYQCPSDELFLVGITGTNGKTTTAFLIKHLLDYQNEAKCGLIGTIEYIIGKYRYQAVRTTPDVSTNQKMLREMVLQGCTSAVMEVTSHALDQRRVDQIHFDVAIFSNLSLDHLDYHQDMETYCRAKSKLFSSLNSKIKKKTHSYRPVAVVNKDSPWYSKILEGCRQPVMTYAIDSAADIKASSITFSSSGTSLNLEFQGKCVPFSWSLIGRFNVYNLLAAVAVGLIKGHSLEMVAEIMKTAVAAPGRLEFVNNPLNLKIYVDFAHSDDALLNVLSCLKELKTGRLITVFGCGGERDTHKRPLMGKVCEENSDIVIVTSDNPRSEDPEKIAQQIVSGFKIPNKHLIELDRSKAIEKAIYLATPEDIILIAGKGHEPYQVFAHKTIEFDDRKVALKHCEKKRAHEQSI